MKVLIILLALTSTAYADWSCEDVKVAVRLAGGVKAAEHIAKVSGVSEADIEKARGCFRHRPKLTLVRGRASTTPDQR